jgi:hypothetical protein
VEVADTDADADADRDAHADPVAGAAGGREPDRVAVGVAVTVVVLDGVAVSDVVSAGASPVLVVVPVVDVALAFADAW